MVEGDDRLEVGRLRAELRYRGVDELLLVVDREHRVVVALEADRRGDLQVHAGAAAHRAAKVTGPDLDVVGQGQQPVAQRVEDPAGTLRPLDREVGPRDISDEQAVAGQHSPGLVAAAQVGQQEAGVLGAVARRVQRLDQQRTQLELVAMVERLVLERGRDQAVDVDGRTGGGRQPTVSGDVVGVVVGLEDVVDAHAQVARQLEVGVDLEPRIDDRRHPRLLVADEVRGAPEVVMHQLPKDHVSSPKFAQRPTRTPRVTAVETCTAAYPQITLAPMYATASP